MAVLEKRTVELRGLRVAYLHDGPEDAPLALLVHGFPDTPRSWVPVAERLVTAGYRVAAPWLRGYAPSGLPADGNFQPGAHVADLVALAAHLGADRRTLLVGHDIGAVIAYGAATVAPKRFGRVATLSVPPLPVLTGLMRTPAQLRRSWYAIRFQLPGAERLVAREDLAHVARLWRTWSPGLDPAPHMADIRAALPSRAHVAAALGWYRASGRTRRHDPALAREQEATAVSAPPQPWLYLHGADDGCVIADAAARVPGGVVVPDAGHFLALEQPDAVAAHLLQHAPVTAVA